MFYRPASTTEILDIVRSKGFPHKKPQDHITSVAETLRDYRDAVAGGERCRRFLIPRPGEDFSVWMGRWEQFQNIGLSETVVDQHAGLLYGKQPKRNWRILGAEDGDPRSKAVDLVMSQIYKMHGGPSLFRRRIAPAWFQDQWTWAQVWSPKDSKTVRISQIDRDFVIPIYDPEDPKDTLVAAVKVTKRGDGHRCELWTEGSYQLVNENWDPAGPIEVNPLGMIPFVPFGDPWGGHQLADTVYDQRLLINLRSWELAGWRYQAFSLLVLMGELLDDEQPSLLDGEKRVRKGINSIWHLNGGDGSDMKWINADVKIKELREAGADLLREAAERAKISATAFDASATPEQSEALKLRMMRPLDDREMNVAMAIPAEERLWALAAKVAIMKGLIEGDATQIEARIEFPDNVLPVDQTQKRQLDASDVSEYRMPLVDYIQSHIRPGCSREDAEKLAADLLAAKAQADDLLAGALGGAINANGPPPRRTPAADLYGNRTPPPEPAPQPVLN